MKKTKEEKESYKRYQKFLENWCMLMATKYCGKDVDINRTWVETAVGMGYNKKLAEYFADKSQYFIGGNRDMIFFKLLDYSRMA